MIEIKQISIRNNAISMRGCWHCEETVISKNKIQFKHTASADYKPDKKYKRDIYSGKSIIPPT